MQYIQYFSLTPYKFDCSLYSRTGSRTDVLTLCVVAAGEREPPPAPTTAAVHAPQPPTLCALRQVRTHVYIVDHHHQPTAVRCSI